MNPRTNAILIGALAGALLGALVGWIIMDDADYTEIGPGGAPRVKVRPQDAVGLGISTINLVRQISGLRMK